MREDRDQQERAGGLDRRRLLGALAAAPAAVVAVPTVARAADEDELAERLMKELEGVDRETAREALDEARERLCEEAIEAARSEGEDEDEDEDDEGDEDDDEEEEDEAGEGQARGAQQGEQGRGQGRNAQQGDQGRGQGRSADRQGGQGKGQGREGAGRQPAEPGHAHNYVEDASSTDHPRHRSGQVCQNCQFWTQMVDDPYGRCVHPSFRDVLVHKGGWCSVYSPGGSS